MSTIYDDAPKLPGIRGDYAKVAHIADADLPRVLIRSVDSVAEDAVTIAMTPDQARAFAAGIVAAAENAEAFQ